MRRSTIHMNKDENEELRFLEKEFTKMSRRIAQISDKTYEENLRERVELLKGKLYIKENPDAKNIEEFKNKAKIRNEELKIENDKLDQEIKTNENELQHLCKKYNKLEQKIKEVLENNQDDNIKISKKSKISALLKLLKTKYIIAKNEYGKVKCNLVKELNDYKSALSQRDKECVITDKEIVELEKLVKSLSQNKNISEVIK